VVILWSFGGCLVFGGYLVVDQSLFGGYLAVMCWLLGAGLVLVWWLFGCLRYLGGEW